MAIETQDPGEVTNIRQSNKELLDRILESPDGEVKQASAAGTNMIRRRIREEGFTRRIIPPMPVTNDDLDRVVTHDRPVIIEDMEPSSPAAVTVPFGAATSSSTFYGNKFLVEFNEVLTPEFVKDINELRTYRMDLRQVITDNSLKDMQTEEDGKFISMIDTIVGTTSGVGNSGNQQHFQYTSTATESAALFSRGDYTQVLSVLEDQNLNNGVILMNRRTAKTFLTFNRSEIGGDLAQSLFTEGLPALQEAKIFGVRHIFTIKKNLVPTGTIYIFGEPSFLGKFYELQSTTMYVEKKKNTLRFSARETIGVTVANVAACAQVDFVTST